MFSFRISLKAFIFSLIFLLLFSFNSLHADIDFFELGNSGGENPVSAEFKFSVTSASAGKTYNAAAVVDILPSWHINSSRPNEDWLIAANLAFDTLTGITPHSINYPKGHEVFLADMMMSTYDNRTIIPFAVSIDASVANGTYSIPMRFSYQPCNASACGAPGEITGDLKVTVGQEGTLTDASVFSTFVYAEIENDAIEPSDVPNTVNEESELQRIIDEYGFWGYFMALGLAFIAGLLLSFSPCTYPMIPITVSIFAGQQRSMGRGFILSLFYVGSMAFTYGIMGMIVATLGGVFGAWLAAPPVVIGIAIVFVIFSLSMFGLYELNVPSSLRNKLGATKSGGGVLGTIILGLVAALVISPCVGPFVGGILLYVSTSGSPFLGFLILFVFAFGLGTLYMIIGTFSSSINKLPNSGMWMDQVKKFFGFVLLLMAAYFLQTIVAPTIIAVVVGLVLLSLGVFGGGLDRLTAESGFFLRLKKLIGIISLLLGIYLLGGTLITNGFILPPSSDWLPAIGSATNSHHDEIDWTTDVPAALAKAKAENKPVIIDTWATWCANCKVLEKETFSNSDVIAESKNFIALKVQLETGKSPEDKAFMKKFGLKYYSLPTTILLDSSGNVKKKIQGVIAPGDLIEEMRKIKTI